MFTYTIGRINILNFHRCRCVSNTILTTHTNITDNRRLNQTKLNICWVLLRSYNYFLLNRKRKKNSCTVQFFFSFIHSLYRVSYRMRLWRWRLISSGAYNRWRCVVVRWDWEKVLMWWKPFIIIILTRRCWSRSSQLVVISVLRHWRKSIFCNQMMKEKAKKDHLEKVLSVIIIFLSYTRPCLIDSCLY